MVKRKESATVDLKVRMKEPLRAALEADARRRGISMNAAAVDRLERSFQEQDRIEHFQPAIYGRQLSAVLEIIGRVMRDTGTHVGFHATGKLMPDWLDDPYAFDQAAKAAVAVLEALRPPGDPTPRSVMRPAGEAAARVMADMQGAWGESFAAGVLEAVGNPDRGGEVGEWAHGPRARLGAAVERLAKFAAKGRKEKKR